MPVGPRLTADGLALVCSWRLLAEVLHVPADPAQMQMNAANHANVRDAIDNDLNAEQRTERGVVLEPLLRLAERVHEHDRVRCAEAFGFNDGRSSTVKKLISNRTGYGLAQPEFAEKEVQPRRLAGRAFRQPFLQSGTERLSDFALDRDGNEARSSASQNPDVVLRWP